MSANLYVRPRNQGKCLPDELKFALRKRYDSKTYMDHRDIPYLQGLVDCDIKGADTLIDYIEKHGEVEVWESY